MVIRGAKPLSTVILTHYFETVIPSGDGNAVAPLKSVPDYREARPLEAVKLSRLPSVDTSPIESARRPTRRAGRAWLQPADMFFLLENSICKCHVPFHLRCHVPFHLSLAVPFHLTLYRFTSNFSRACTVSPQFWESHVLFHLTQKQAKLTV